MTMSRRTLMGGAAAAAAVAGSAPAREGEFDPVIELRQYKIVRGRRDAFVALFDREFVDPQEALGMRLVGQFRDMDDPDRFTWIREFPDYAERAGKLSAFYSGPVWQAHRAEANLMLDDNDNVLLLRPSIPGAGFGAIERRPRDGREGGLLVATIHYLWKAPAEGFSPFFEQTGRAALAGAGVRVLGSYVAETRPNGFPRLPVRQGERVFVWFARVGDMRHYQDALSGMRGPAAALRGGHWLLLDLEERAAQVLRLSPTPRSRL